ncbi:LysR family transcriptional regulator [Pseudomonas sp. PA15(2017)]|uniref:LysR family transcriptional regulator n=1 Tax=Pseudomonas sp. PA15(2017) TaxID=1932111 RepID=UPI000969DB74|nr:LysR family transcriptional regulator [Pseudomonas sp. PA15(2017)]OLU26251.1 LysR family transcriptional regulator [Pseudomonas sp. PA15(2017)]
MLRELKTFLTVVRCGTFAAAGKQIGLTQSAVSAQIRNLEDSVGQALFDRTGRTATLNQAGARAVPLAEKILEQFSLMSTPERLEDYRGELRIGAIGTVQSCLMPAMLLKLREQAPGIETKLVPGVSLDLLNQVDSGEIDLAIIIRPPFQLPKELELELVRSEPFVLVAPIDMDANEPLKMLTEHPFIRYDRSSFGGRQVTQFMRRQRIQPRQVLELDELDAIAKMVESGLGIALIPEAGLWVENKPQVQIIDLGDKVFHRDLVLISRYGSRQSPAQKLFRACVMAQV